MYKYRHAKKTSPRGAYANCFEVTVSNTSQWTSAWNGTLPECLEITLANSLSIQQGVTIPKDKTVIIQTSETAQAATLTREMQGAIFTVEAGGKLILQNVNIDGNKSAYDNGGGPLVQVKAELNGQGDVVPGMLEMDNVEMRNNTCKTPIVTSQYSSGAISCKGELTMTRSKVYGNVLTLTSGEEAHGGGVSSAGLFTMIDSEIYDNAVTPGGRTAVAMGGGVYNSGTFTMTNSNIKNNKSEPVDNPSAGSGGGVFNGGVMIMNGGEISNNMAGGNGGGIQLSTIGTLTINGNALLKNNHAENGGAICSRRWKDGEDNIVVGKVTGIEHISEDVEFSNNFAEAGGFEIARADIPLSDEVVHTHNVTLPFIYAYNNMDICYLAGEPVESICVYLANLPDGCGLYDCYFTDEDGRFSELPPEPDADCLAEGAYFCGWYIDDDLTTPVTTDDVFEDGDIIYACIECESPDAYYDPELAECVPIDEPTGPSGPTDPTIPTLPTAPPPPTLPTVPTIPTLPTVPTGPITPTVPPRPPVIYPPLIGGDDDLWDDCGPDPNFNIPISCVNPWESQLP